MRNTKYILAFAWLSGALILGISGSAQELQAGLVVEPAAPKVVGRVAEEIVTLENTGDTALPAGVLEVTFPSEVRLEFGTPIPVAITGQVAKWQVPALAAGATYEIRYVLTPLTAGQGLVISYRYFINDQVVGQTQVSSSVIAEAPRDAGLILGETLPRTGAE